MAKYRVPLRVSFTGCATDVPDRLGYYRGAAVCASIDKYVEVSITTNNHEPSFIEPSCDLIEKLLEKVPFEADIPRMQIRWTADIPLGSGLGGSSALLVAVAKHFFSNPLYQASFASQVELERSAGWQDAAICAYGACRAFKFSRNGFTLTETLAMPESEYFMLVSSGLFHDTAKQLSHTEPHTQDFIERNAERVRLCREALYERNYEMLGKVVNEVHAVKNLNPTYSIAGMDEFLAEMMANGAYGGTLLGSGGGGHYLLVVDPAKREGLNEIIREYNYQDVPFSFC